MFRWSVANITMVISYILATHKFHELLLWNVHVLLLQTWPKMSGYSAHMLYVRQSSPVIFSRILLMRQTHKCTCGRQTRHHFQPCWYVKFMPLLTFMATDFGKSLCYACLPTVFDLVLPVEGPLIVFVVSRSTQWVIRMHGASLRVIARQPEVALASWWNNQDPGQLLSQRRTLSGPCSGLLPEYDK